MMKCGNENRLFLAPALFGALLLSFALLAGNANAALITGSVGFFGSFTASGGNDLSDATTLNLGNTMVASSTGDLAPPAVTMFDQANINNVLVFDPSTVVINLLDINGFQIDVATSTIIDQTAGILTLTGTGAISAAGFDLTPTTWVLSADDLGAYSMTVSAVPVPAAVWLFGSGLIGLIAVARRKTV